MNKLLSLFLLVFLSQASFAQQPLILPIVGVHDGDTIKTSLPLPFPLNVVSIRVRGIDTPELPAPSYPRTGKLGRAKCVKEAELALKAKQAVKNIIDGSSGVMVVTNYGYGKFAGRIVGDVFIKNINIATFLVSRGYAVRYDGGQKTHDWCQ